MPATKHMTRRPSVRRCLLLSCLLFLFLNGMSLSAQAGTRRALVIGINQYAVDPIRDRTPNLEGAVHDAEAIAAVLHTYHQVDANNIIILRDREAGREQIIANIRQHLIVKSAPGDLAIFYFAGHGSYIDAPSSKERDRRDETIVPADSNRGAQDIRDKELSSLFNEIIDKQAQLVAFFDSCHSGSVARGVPTVVRTRFAPPLPMAGAANNAAGGSGQEAPPEQRGALILAAAQDAQLAQEIIHRGEARGRFSLALQQTLAQGIDDLPAELVFLRLKAQMQATGSGQEPTLAALPQRRKLTIFGSSPRAEVSRGVLAILRRTSSGFLVQGGHAVGLGQDAILRRRGAGPLVRLRIAEPPGLTESQAVSVEGNDSDVAGGDLFEIESYGRPVLTDRLRIFVPEDSLPQAALSQQLAMLAGVRSNGQWRWVEDPTEAQLTHRLTFRHRRWILEDVRASADAPVYARATLDARGLTQALNRLRAASVFLQLPPTTALAEGLAQAYGSAESTVQQVPMASSATYLLVGRLRAGQIEYAWVLPNLSPGTVGMALPARAAWHPILPPGEPPLAPLQADALQIARLWTWLTLDGASDRGRFPYTLRVLERRSGRLLELSEVLRAGEAYELALHAPVLQGRVAPRYVYVFAMDSHGQSTLLIPGGGLPVGENLLPDLRDRTRAAHATIPLNHPFIIGPPYGTETLVLLTSATAIPHLSVFQTDPIQRSVDATCRHPLECLIFGINSNSQRAVEKPPQDWSLDRLLLRSQEPPREASP